MKKSQQILKLTATIMTAFLKKKREETAPHTTDKYHISSCTTSYIR
ncbi:MAG TPA: hypothetical protein VFF57_06655 [Hanamia sp.]|nr:hypothetical protein [Hanamia sp.]